MYKKDEHMKGENTQNSRGFQPTNRNKGKLYKYIRNWTSLPTNQPTATQPHKQKTEKQESKYRKII